MLVEPPSPEKQLVVRSAKADKTAIKDFFIVVVIKINVYKKFWCKYKINYQKNYIIMKKNAK